jgi:hypothetical protein
VGAVSVKRDALTYLEALHGERPQPSVIVVTPTKPSGGFARSHFVRSPQDALDYVLGAVDVYVRVTPIAGRLKDGRGTAADAIALPAVWAELDVDGTPGRDGKVKSGAFPHVEAAADVAGAVLEPSLLVGSGGGVHPYWLLDHPLELRSDEDRERARRLVQGFQARLRQEARDRFGAGIDSTFDLARVLRPPGSMNGKGPTPRPVELLDDGGRRYTLEELAAQTVKVDDAPAAGGDSGGGPGRPVEELLSLFGDVARLLNRKGRKPGDGSPSAWDYTMCCRAGEHECSDPELVALLREARRRHGDAKGERDDYIERTIAAVRQKVGYPASSPKAILERLTKDIHAAQVGLTLADVRVSGYGDRARVAFVFSDGSELDFPHAEQIATASRLASGLANTIGIAAEFSPLQARRVAAHVRRYAGRTNERRERDEAITWGIDFLRLAGAEVFDFADQASRFRRWRELHELDPDEQTSVRSAEAYARKSIVAVDGSTGIRYVRAGWFQEYVRRIGATAGQADVMELMLDVGWKRKGNKGRIKATDPAGLGKPIGMPFYVVPAGWEDEQEAEE